MVTKLIGRRIALNKQKDDLQTFFEPIRQVWRTRQLSFQVNGKRIDKIGRFYLDNSVPGSVLNVIDALGLETKAGLKPVICHKHQENEMSIRHLKFDNIAAPKNRCQQVVNYYYFGSFG